MQFSSASPALLAPDLKPFGCHHGDRFPATSHKRVACIFPALYYKPYWATERLGIAVNMDWASLDYCALSEF